MTVELEMLEQFRLMAEDVRHPNGYPLMSESKLIDIIKGNAEENKYEILSANFDQIITAPPNTYKTDYGYDNNGIIWERYAIEDFVESSFEASGDSCIPFTRRFDVDETIVNVSGVIQRVSGMFNLHWVNLWKWPVADDSMSRKDAYEHLAESLLWRIPLEYMGNKEATIYALECSDTEHGTYTISNTAIISYPTFPHIHDENRSLIFSFIEWVKKRGLEENFNKESQTNIVEML